MTALFASAALFLFVDQLSKSLVELRVGNGSVAVGPLFRLKHVAGTKRLYSSNVGRGLLVALWIAALLSAIAIARLTPAFRTRVTMIALGTALGGATGNLADILRTRSVFDFIDFRFWPTFNLADVAIITGVIVAFWSLA